MCVRLPGAHTAQPNHLSVFKMYGLISSFISGSPFLALPLEMRVNGKGNLNNTPHFFVYDFPSKVPPSPPPPPRTRRTPPPLPICGRDRRHRLGHAVLLLIWRRRQETISRLQQKPRRKTWRVMASRGSGERRYQSLRSKEGLGRGAVVLAGVMRTDCWCGLAGC